jgi:molybdate transport system regulatory protein
MTRYPAISVRIDLGEARRLGPGKIRLLELIMEKGSIAAAARGMGMSYRRAWLLTEEVNALFGVPLVSANAGGAKGGAAAVSLLGQEIVKSYRDVERAASELVEQRIVALVQGAGNQRSSIDTDFNKQ